MLSYAELCPHANPLPFGSSLLTLRKEKKVIGGRIAGRGTANCVSVLKTVPTLSVYTGLAVSGPELGTPGHISSYLSVSGRLSISREL